MIRQFNTEVQLKRPGREFPVLFCFFLSEIFAEFLKNFLNAPLHTVVCRRLCYNRNDQGIQGGIKMAVSSIKVYFQSDLEWVWDVVTSLEDTAWRSDISKVEAIDDRRFIEYTTDGYATTFTVTGEELYRRWEFDMENDNMRGHWTGIFTRKGEGTEVEFTEDVTAKKFFAKPFVKGYLKKQQALYVKDLRKALQDE